MTPWWIPSRSDVLTAATVALLALAAFSSGAQAGEPGSPPSAEETQARAKLAEAQQAYDLGQFREALGHYSEAYRLMPLPGFLFNIAQCQRQLGNHERAAFFYQRYLDLLPSAPNAEAARALLAESRRRVAELEAEARRKSEAEARRQEWVQRPAFTPPAHDSRVVASGNDAGILHRWWFWTGVGVVAAGAVGVGLAVGLQPHARVPSLGTVNDR